MPTEIASHVAHTRVRTTDYALPRLDPFDVFLSLRNYFGPECVYLLESLSGPARDSLHSFIGFDPLVTVKVHDRLVQVTGNPGLRTRILDKAARDRTVIVTSESVSLVNRQGLWDFLRSVQSGFDIEQPSRRESNGLSFGFFGYFGYDTAWAIEDLPRRIPSDRVNWDVSLTIYRGLIRADLREGGECTLILHASDSFPSGPPVEELKDLLLSEPASRFTLAAETTAPPVPGPLRITDSIEAPAYMQNVEKALQYIRIGDIYQVQLGHELTITSTAHPFDVYRRLRVRNPSPYMFLAPFGDLTVVGASPELFLSVLDGRIEMRPIAGTTRRSPDPVEDAALTAALLADEKEMAEHIMLVDLCRNDIGRVCRPRTLHVDELAIVESYSHVHHLVSNVSGTLRDDYDVYAAMAATFPAGTMTGAPKIRAMEIIEELETSRRGVYAGAIGIIGFDNSALTALCIRTAMHYRDRFFVRASAGVVADSVPENEWRETLRKMASLHWAITGEDVRSEVSLGATLGTAQ
jgi:anthranilate synthase component 1